MAIYQLNGDQPELPANGACWIAPSADVIGKVRLLQDASIWFAAVLRGDNEWITLGQGSNIQDGAICHTDMDAPLLIGAGCTIGHRAILHGCTISDGSLIGMGATVLNHAVIGKNCLIGANSLITEGKIIPDNALVVGSPGRIVRQLSDDEITSLSRSAANYVANWKRFKTGLGT